MSCKTKIISDSAVHQLIMYAKKKPEHVTAEYLHAHLVCSVLKVKFGVSDSKHKQKNWQ